MQTTLTSLLYVSDSLLDPSNQQDEAAKIVAVAVERNAALGVTGALIFTGAYFAQVLEGPAAAVDELMSSIFADGRHTNVDLVEVAGADGRSFPDWSMAYSGPSNYVDRHIRPLFKQVAEPRTRISAARALRQMMREFAAAGGVHQGPG